MNAIEIKGLSKSFRGLYAVNELNMTVPQGAIYGFIGEHGSGKSTTEKLICGQRDVYRFRRCKVARGRPRARVLYEYRFCAPYQ